MQYRFDGIDFSATLMSYVTCNYIYIYVCLYIYIFFSLLSSSFNLTDLIGGGSGINGAYPVQFPNMKYLHFRVQSRLAHFKIVSRNALTSDNASERSGVREVKSPNILQTSDTLGGNTFSNTIVAPDSQIIAPCSFVLSSCALLFSPCSRLLVFLLCLCYLLFAFSSCPLFFALCSLLLAPCSLLLSPCSLLLAPCFMLLASYSLIFVLSPCCLLSPFFWLLPTGSLVLAQGSSQLLHSLILLCSKD